jgi:hypothetical protein
MFNSRPLLDRFTLDHKRSAVEPTPTSVDPLERRSTPRFVPLEHRSWLARRSGETFHPVPVRLLDIGAGGVLIESMHDASTGEEVWFWLDQVGDPSELVPAWVVGVTQGTRDQYRIRLEFQAPCPEHVLKRALQGGLQLRPRPYSVSSDAGEACGVVFVSPAMLFT